MVAGSSALLALAIYLVFHYLGLREAGATDAMLLTDSVVWYAPLNIHYAVGVDGISVAMLLLSAIIVFTGTFASWQMKSDVKGLLPLVLPAERRRFRVLYLGGPLHDVHVLRGGADPDVPADRRLGQRPQGVCRHEADADAHGRFGAAADRHSGHLFRRRGDDDEYSGNRAAAQHSARAAVCLVSAGLRRVRRAGRAVPVPYVESRRPCLGSDGGVDAPCRGADEAGRLRLFPRGDVPDA